MFSQDKVQEALHFAALWHGDQKYPGKSYTYLVHITLVAFEMANAITNASINDIDMDEDLAMQCAILHDVIEDSADVSYLSVREKFGQKVADGVMALTKNLSLEDKNMKMIDSLKRIKMQPKEIWMVKMADRITNLQTPPSHWALDKRKSYKEEAMLIYNELKEADEFLEKRLLEKIKAYEAII